MAEVTLDQISKEARDLFNKGFTAFERGNLDYAIDLLFSCVEKEPQLLKARKFLRAAEVQRFKNRKENIFARGLSSVKGTPALLGSIAMARGNPLKAVIAAEKLLKDDPVNPKFVKAFAEAAASAKLPEAAIQTLEVARDHHPDNLMIINLLGKLYANTGRTRQARQCFERICELAPNDPDAVKQLKDAMAIDSISSDGWEEATEEGKDYRSIIKDTHEATVIEQEAKAVKSEKDVQSLITDTEAKIEAEPDNVNYYRQLARLYSDNKQFDEAVATINRALELSPGDPELDSTLSKTNIQKYKFLIAQYRDAGDEENAQAMENELENYIFNNLQERVARYPNDLELRYDWGAKLLQHGYLDDAIKQFQLSQRNPKRRIVSLYSLASCFRQKNLSDMARDQLTTALSELSTMNDEKKDVLYELGSIAEESGDSAKALEYYKQIYQVDISYKDIAQKIEGMYQQ